MTNPNPAFPIAVFLREGETHYEWGLSKRELFAAMAMQGMIAHQTENSYITEKDLALISVKYADSLISALYDTEVKDDRP